MSVALLCVFSFITGLGSSAAFGGAIKVGRIVESEAARD
jgi:hypothetical protein